MKIVDNFSESQIKQVFELYSHAWWAKDRSFEQTVECINGSQVCIGVVDSNGKVIGFARAITDFIFKAMIFDVIVCPNHRNKGLGNKVMRSIQRHDKLKNVRHFELYCLPDMEAYYSNLGFKTDVGGIRLLRKING